MSQVLVRVWMIEPEVNFKSVLDRCLMKREKGQGGANLRIGRVGQIKYEKSVQWLGEDPFFVSKVERYLVGTTGDVLVSTAMFIVMCMGGAVGIGLLGGYIYFMKREQRRLTRHAFSDAGGLTRLNLDELTE